MRPGSFSRSGFLGPNESLVDVISADARTLSELDLSCALLASELDELVSAAEVSPNRQARSGALQCQVQVHQGFQICPWARDPDRAQCDAGLGVSHASIDWRITNLETAEEMKGPGLVIHLIRDHEFFEGPMSPNRVDPLALARLLGKIERSHR
jgi:hypothetical protein